MDLLDRIFQPLVGDFTEEVFKKMSMIHLKDHPYNFKLASNVILRHEKGMAQIDQILFSQVGIFVIEIKGFKGWIFGSENQRDWTQCLYGGRKYKFYNPIWQNNTHIKALKENTGLPWNKFKPIILFSGEVQLKTKLPPYVVKGLNYVDYIKCFTEQIVTDEEIDQAVTDINKKRLSPKEHEEYLKSIKNDYRPKMTQKEFLKHAKNEILKDIIKFS